MKSTFVGVLAALSIAAGGLAACSVEIEESEDVGQVEQEAKGQIFCGGFANFPCPEGMACVDDPRDDCDPDNGGADCGGVCKRDAGPKDCNAKKKNQDKEYVAEGDTCMVIKFFCADGMEPFFDECGCGCQPLPGEECNGVVCGAGEYCCNYSCSTCVPDGGFCTMQVCESI
jgi:hypothetical protein